MLPLLPPTSLDCSWEGKLMINPEMWLRLVVNLTGSEEKDVIITMDLFNAETN